MDWKLFGSTFAVVFLAEVGDKTQLASLVLTAQSRRPYTVFLAACLALILATAIGVALGDMVARFIPEFYITRAAAVLFIAVGVLLWFRVV